MANDKDNIIDLSARIAERRSETQNLFPNHLFKDQAKQLNYSQDEVNEEKWIENVLEDIRECMRNGESAVTIQIETPEDK